MNDRLLTRREIRMIRQKRRKARIIVGILLVLAFVVLGSLGALFDYYLLRSVHVNMLNTVNPKDIFLCIAGVALLGFVATALVLRTIKQAGPQG